MDEYLSVRMISDPFGLLDCDVPVDGSVAFVVSTTAAAADCDHPVRVGACGGSLGLGGWDQRPDYPKMASTDAAAEMWSRTDLKPVDVDVAELYDGFTFLTFAWLEALGFCGDGEAGPFVEGAARIALDGELPLNTYGGQLSAGRMHGNWVLHEACLQLRGEAGERQVGKHDVAVVSNGGGPIAGCMVLTRSNGRVQRARSVAAGYETVGCSSRGFVRRNACANGIRLRPWPTDDLQPDGEAVDESARKTRSGEPQPVEHVGVARVARSERSVWEGHGPVAAPPVRPILDLRCDYL